MKFGIFYEHQIPRPWDANAEHRIYREALEQVELADRIASITRGRSSTISLRNIPIPPRQKCFWRRARNAQSAYVSATASCSCRQATIILLAWLSASPRSIWSSDGRVEFGTGEVRRSSNWAAIESMSPTSAQRGKKRSSNASTS